MNKLRKLLSILLVFGLLFDTYFLPLASINSAFAQEQTTEEIVVVDSTPSPEPEPTAEPILEVNGLSVSPTPEATNDPLVVSDDEGSVEVTPSAQVVSQVWKENEDGSVTTIEKVGEGVIYQYKDTQVKVVFTKVTTPGYLTIKEVELKPATETEPAVKGYEVTSDMQNGTFEYDLTLPVPQEMKDNFTVKYAESVDQISEAKVVEETKEVVGDVVTIKGLNHFTVFIITDDEAIYNTGGMWFDWSDQGFLDAGVHFPKAVPAGQTATWAFSSITPGIYEVYISWSTHPNRTTAAPYTLNYNGGSAGFTINQEQLADQATVGGSGEWSGWYKLGSYSLSNSSTLVLSSVDNSSGQDYVIADEVKIDSLSAKISSVSVNKDFYKKGDPLTIGVEVLNDGDVNLDPTKEKLTVNIKAPGGAYLYGTFREQQGVSLAPGESHVYNFYTSPQTIPDAWVEGTYTVATSIYSSRATGMGYLPGGQSSGTQFIVDNTVPDQVEGLTIYKGHNSVPGNELECGGYTNNPAIRIEWNSSSDSNISHYWFGNKFDSKLRRVNHPQTYYDGNMTPGNNPYFYTVIAVDKAGNESVISDQCGLILDQISPVTPVITNSPNNSYTNVNLITINWQGGGDVGPFSSGVKEYEIGYVFTPASGGSPVSWSTRRPGNPKTHSGTYGHGEGKYDIYVKTIDNAGNTSGSSAIFSITYDKTAPSAPTPILPVDGDFISNAAFNQTWTLISDATQYFYESCKIDPGDAGGPCPAPSIRYTDYYPSNIKHVASGQPSSHFWWRVKARDAAGNWSSFGPSFELNIDAGKPIILGAPATLPNPTNVTTQNWIWTAAIDTGGSGVKGYSKNIYSYASGSWSGWLWLGDVLSAETNLAEGLWKFAVRAVDNVGNIGFRSDSDILTVDLTAPVTTITAPATPDYFNEPINIEGATTDANGVDEVTLSYATYDGDTCGVYATITTIDNPADNSPFVWSYSWTPAEGRYCIKAAGRDTVGNEENSAVVYDIVYDRTAPEISWENPLDGDTVIGLTNLQVGLADNLSKPDDASVQYFFKPEGGSETDIDDNPWDTRAPLPLGEYQLIARVEDLAGNPAEESIMVGVAAVVSGETHAIISQTNTTITWLTDRPTSSRVVWDTVSHPSLGSAPNYGYAHSTGTLNTSPKVLFHSVEVTGLIPEVTYYFRVISEGSPVAIGEQKEFKTPDWPDNNNSGGSSDNGGQTAGASTTVPVVLASSGTGGAGLVMSWASGDEGYEASPTPTPTPTASPKPVVESWSDNEGLDKRAIIGIAGLTAAGALLLLLFFKKRKKKK